MENRSVKVWLGDIESNEKAYPTHWSMLDKNERQQANNFKNDPLRQRYVAIHAKLRVLLAQTVDVDPSGLRILKAQHGKPYLADYPDVAFNLSHTANMMAAAIAFHYELGIDIEWCKPRANLSALVEKCFADEEKRYWQQLPDSKKLPEFYRFWTRKEAFVKATGRGIALGLKQCVINPNKPSEFLKIPEEFGPPSDWPIHDIRLDKEPSIVGALVMNTGTTANPIEVDYLI